MKKSELRQIIKEELLKEEKLVDVSTIARNIEDKFLSNMTKAVEKKLLSILKGKKVQVHGNEEYGGGTWKDYTGVVTDVDYSQYYDAYEIVLTLDNKTDVLIGNYDVKIL